MVATKYLSVAVTTLGLVAAAPSTVLKPRKDDPLGSNLPSDFTDRGVCVANDYGSDDSRKNVWQKARGGELIDAYLNQNSRDKWITNVAKKLFPGENAAQFDCLTSASQCTVNDKDCPAFAEHSADGMYQVMVSLQNFHTFIAQYLSNLNFMCDDVSNSMEQIASKFGKDKAKQPISGLAILSGVLSMGAGFATASPPAAGALGALSGITSIASVALDDKGGDTDLSKAGLESMVQATCKYQKDSITKVLNAVMGVPGSSEADIPEAMTVDEGKKWVHRITYLFGNGQWLLDNPTLGMQDKFETMGLQFKQALAWQMLRDSNHVKLVINDASPCKDVNEVKDDKNGYCYGLMAVSDAGDNLLGGINDKGAPLWAPTSAGGLGMDKLTTYRNALDCWQSNNNNVGQVVPNQNPTDTGIPKCFFGMEVKKGKWHDIGSGHHYLDLDKSFGNFDPRDPGKDKATWPQTPCKNAPIC